MLNKLVNKEFNLGVEYKLMLHKKVVNNHKMLQCNFVGLKLIKVELMDKGEQGSIITLVKVT